MNSANFETDRQASGSFRQTARLGCYDGKRILASLAQHPQSNCVLQMSSGRVANSPVSWSASSVPLRLAPAPFRHWPTGPPHRLIITPKYIAFLAPSHAPPIEDVPAIAMTHR